MSESPKKVLIVEELDGYLEKEITAVIAPSYNQKHYRPALKRFLHPILSAQFQRELTR